jgi:hypothetical protein
MDLQGKKDAAHIIAGRDLDTVRHDGTSMLNEDRPSCHNTAQDFEGHDEAVDDLNAAEKITRRIHVALESSLEFAQLCIRDDEQTVFVENCTVANLISTVSSSILEQPANGLRESTRQLGQTNPAAIHLGLAAAHRWMQANFSDFNAHPT